MQHSLVALHFATDLVHYGAQPIDPGSIWLRVRREPDCSSIRARAAALLISSTIASYKRRQAALAQVDEIVRAATFSAYAIAGDGPAQNPPPCRWARHQPSISPFCFSAADRDGDSRALGRLPPLSCWPGDVRPLQRVLRVASTAVRSLEVVCHTVTISMVRANCGGEIPRARATADVDPDVLAAFVLFSIMRRHHSFHRQISPTSGRKCRSLLPASKSSG